MNFYSYCGAKMKSEIDTNDGLKIWQSKEEKSEKTKIYKYEIDL